MEQEEYEKILKIQSYLYTNHLFMNDTDLKNNDTDLKSKRKDLKIPDIYYDLILDTNIYEELFNLMNDILLYKYLEEIDLLFCKYYLGFVEYIDDFLLNSFINYVLMFDIKVLYKENIYEKENTKIKLLLLLYKYKNEKAKTLINVIKN